MEDNTERKYIEVAWRGSNTRQSFLLKLDDARRLLADPKQISTTTSRVLGQHLGAYRAAYFDVRRRNYYVARDYTKGVPALAGSLSDCSVRRAYF